MVEKAFCRLKTNFNLRRLKINSDKRIYGKLLISIITLIINSFIYKIMIDTNLYSKFKQEKLLNELYKAKLSLKDDKIVISPVSKINRQFLS
ncbi:MAG: hypothetical protein LBV23_07530 [Deltaproteobacteria bacterium]|jgi:transposase|nr:hypothetical protein [Deltaproteobacteria bacterium]